MGGEVLEGGMMCGEVGREGRRGKTINGCSLDQGHFKPRTKGASSMNSSSSNSSSMSSSRNSSRNSSNNSNKSM